MKKIVTLYILTIGFHFVSYCQFPTLVQNDPSFCIDITNQSSTTAGTTSGSCATGVCMAYSGGGILFDGIDKNAFVGVNLNCNKQTSSIIFDTKRPIRLQNIIATGWSVGIISPSFTITLECSNSPLGPWFSIESKQCIPSYLSGNYADYSLGGVTSPKVAQFWRVTFPVYYVSGQTCSFRHLLTEVKLYELPLITSSLSNPMMNGQCTTLTAAAGGETYLWSPGGQTTQSISVCNSGTYTCQVTNTSFTGNQDHTASIAVSTLGTQDNWVGPNGEVYSIHRSGNTVYYGGDFNAVGPITGSGAQISETTGAANTAFPRISGTVNVTIPDGSGGWYVGGTFSRIGNNTDVSNLAHIKSDGTLDTGFKPVPNGAVNTLAIYGSSLYVGGAFTTIQGLSNNYVAKVNKASGTPIFWNANCNNIVRSMQLYADQLIIGGDFTSLGGVTRNYLGAVDTTYVQATTWTPNPNAAVYKVFVNGTKLYVGGDFTTISAVSRSRGAGYSLPGFTLDGYNFGANNRIHDFAFNNNVLYAAGTFTTIGGATRNYLAGLNSLNMVANSFNATADGVLQTQHDYLTPAPQNKINPV